MQLGAKKLKWLALDCCDMVLNTTNSHIAKVWLPPAKGVHMIFGFVGLMYYTWWKRNTGGDFAEDICEGWPLSIAWINEMSSSYWDNYPIALAFGSTHNEASMRLGMESLACRDWDVVNGHCFAWMAWVSD